MTQKTLRLEVNINRETAAELDLITIHEDISYTEAVRKAVAIYKYLRDAQDRGDAIIVGKMGALELL